MVSSALHHDRGILGPLPPSRVSTAPTDPCAPARRQACRSPPRTPLPLSLPRHPPGSRHAARAIFPRMPDSPPVLLPTRPQPSPARPLAASRSARPPRTHVACPAKGPNGLVARPPAPHARGVPPPRSHAVPPPPLTRRAARPAPTRRALRAIHVLPPAFTRGAPPPFTRRPPPPLTRRAPACRHAVPRALPNRLVPGAAPTRAIRAFAAV